MKCETHDCEMEWMPCEAHPEGSWFCAECFADEEAQYVGSDDEYLENLNRIMNVGRFVFGTVEKFDAKARGRIRHARMMKGKHGIRRPKK